MEGVTPCGFVPTGSLFLPLHSLNASLQQRRYGGEYEIQRNASCCERLRPSSEVYHDMFGLQLLQDHDGNMELTGGLYLQEAEYLEKFLEKSITPKSNSTELYFEEDDIEASLRSFKSNIRKLSL